MMPNGLRNINKKEMKIIFFFIVCMFFSACSNKLIPGDYFYKNYGHIEIDKDLNYKYNNFNHTWLAISSGKVLRKGDTLFFVPDSSYFFTIKVKKIIGNGQHPGKKTIVLVPDSSNEFSLKNFTFYFDTENSHSKTFYFDSSGICSIQDTSLDLDFGLFSKLNGEYAPRPIKEYLISNIIHLKSIPEPWDTLKLITRINFDMFSLRELENMIIKHKRLVEADPTIYKLE